MEITLLGQAGVHIIMDSGKRIVIDPYLTDTLYELKGTRFTRLVPVNPGWKEKVPDVIAITHEHADHMDMPLLRQWLGGEKTLQILATLSVYKELSGLWPAKHNIMVMSPDVEATIDDVRFRAVPAFHEMPDAVGYLIEAEEKKVYITGDTLYSSKIIGSLSGYNIDLMMPCINGFGNNMNYVDAARLVNNIRPSMVIPVHWDMFADFGADPGLFACKVIPDIEVRILRAYSSISL
jgi:L-ascorbate metabolism protein UlaG (beta-lactamase superfamily)